MENKRQSFPSFFKKVFVLVLIIMIKKIRLILGVEEDKVTFLFKIWKVNKNGFQGCVSD